MIHPWNTSILSRITKLAVNECLIPYLLSHRHILISVNIRGGQHISLICFIYLRLPLSNSYQLSCSDKVKVSAVFNLVGFRLRLWWVNSILLFFDLVSRKVVVLPAYIFLFTLQYPCLWLPRQRSELRYPSAVLFIYKLFYLDSPLDSELH